VRIGPDPNGTRKSASGANGDGDGNVSSKLRRAWQQKEGSGKPKGVRLTVRTDSAGANPMGGAKVEKTWRVAKVGAQRCKTAWSTQSGKRVVYCNDCLMDFKDDIIDVKASLV
jgi:hypothetical protein